MGRGDADPHSLRRPLRLEPQVRAVAFLDRGLRSNCVPCPGVVTRMRCQLRWLLRSRVHRANAFVRWRSLKFITITPGALTCHFGSPAFTRVRSGRFHHGGGRGFKSLIAHLELGELADPAVTRLLLGAAGPTRVRSWLTRSTFLGLRCPSTLRRLSRTAQQ